MSIKSLMPSNHLILYHHLLLLPSILPRIRDFSIESALHIRWSKYWSFRISPSNEYAALISFKIDWFDLLSVPRDSQVSSPTPQFENINFLVLSLPNGPPLTFVHDYWNNYNFDYLNLCQQSDIAAFLIHCLDFS